MDFFWESLSIRDRYSRAEGTGVDFSTSVTKPSTIVSAVGKQST